MHSPYLIRIHTCRPTKKHSKIIVVIQQKRAINETLNDNNLILITSRELKAKINNQDSKISIDYETSNTRLHIKYMRYIRYKYDILHGFEVKQATYLLTELENTFSRNINVDAASQKSYGFGCQL